MVDTLIGLELLTERAVQFAKTLIQPGEKVIGCIRATAGDENTSFIALDTRLLFIDPIGKRSHSIEYMDIKTVEAKEQSMLFIPVVVFEVRTDARGDAGLLELTINRRHQDYTARFAETVRNKMRDARMPTLNVEPREKNPAAFIDELERLYVLYKNKGLTDEEYKIAKKKLLS